MGAEFARYLVAGVVNTAVGYAAFLAFFWGIGLGARLANALSYAVGLMVALLLNRLYVFKGATFSAGAVLRFGVGFGLAYALNLATLNGLLAAGWRAEIAQIGAMAVYTVGFYGVNRWWVWRDRAH